MLVLDKQANHPAARNTFLEIRGRVRDSIISMFTQSLAPELLDAAPELPDHLTTLIIALSDGYFLSVQLGDALDPDVFVEIAMSIVETAIRDAELEFL